MSEFDPAGLLAPFSTETRYIAENKVDIMWYINSYWKDSHGVSVLRASDNFNFSLPTKYPVSNT